MDTRVGVLLWALMLYMVEAKVKDISCFTCTSSYNNPLKCTRPEYMGTYKHCVAEGPSLVQATTCFKSVNTKTGEVNKGCATPAMMMDTKTPSLLGLLGLQTFYCNTKLCNGASSWLSGMIGPVIVIHIILW
eukprot:GFUD01054227.1.p1 GENE.GFUD01054227.1~~GFUD01054227.1.p1  ORF type:complete len:132 (+),score=35.49 GFUD01054227.1:29-424(+)